MKTLPTTTGWARSIVLALAVALLAAACSGSTTTTLADPLTQDDQPSLQDDTGDQAQDSTAETDAEPAPTQAPEPTAVPEPTVAPEPTATSEPEPTPERQALPFLSDVLSVGDCYMVAEPGVIPDPLPCDELHEHEIFAMGSFDDFGPDEPFPGQDVLADLASEQCGPATLEFGGETWDLLPFLTFQLLPVVERWEAGDRSLICAAGSTDQGELKIGTAAGGSLDSSDVLLGRTVVVSDGEEFEQWVTVREQDFLETAGTAANGELDLPLRRAYPVAQGFIFQSNEDDGSTNTWGYSWESGELTDLNSILPGQEMASLIINDGVSVFAARETSSDDWDLWSNTGDGVVPIFDGPGDQHYPVLTPDNTQVVFHDDGDLWVANVDGSNARQLTSGPANDFESAVSPDGQWVAFASDRSGNDDIWLVPFEGGEPTNLTNHPAFDAWPTFSADGKLIYFQTDRLRPDFASRVMMMSLDGSDASWFSNLNVSQVVPIDERVRDQVVETLPTLNERYNYEEILGETDTLVAWEHSSGRIAVELPVGWRVGEFDTGTGFIASPRPDQYFETWAIDGLVADLFDEPQDEFFARLDDTAAVTSCEQIDGTDGIIEFSPGVLAVAASHDCGSDSVGQVLAFYNTEINVGLLLEGQRDNEPTAEADEDLLNAIAMSIIWN